MKDGLSRVVYQNNSFDMRFTVTTRHREITSLEPTGITFKGKDEVLLYNAFKNYLRLSIIRGQEEPLINCSSFNFNEERKEVIFIKTDIKLENIIGKFFLETGLDWPDEYYTVEKDCSKKYKQLLPSGVSLTEYKKGNSTIRLGGQAIAKIDPLAMELMRIVNLRVINQLLQEIENLWKDKTEKNLSLILEKFNEARFKAEKLRNSESSEDIRDGKKLLHEIYHKLITFYAENDQIEDLVEIYKNYFISKLDDSYFSLNSNDKIAFDKAALEVAQKLMALDDDVADKEFFKLKQFSPQDKQRLILLLLKDNNHPDAEFLRRQSLYLLKGNKKGGVAQASSFCEIAGLPEGASVIYGLTISKDLIKQIQAGKAYVYEQLILNPDSPKPVKINAQTNNIDIDGLKCYVEQGNEVKNNLLNKLLAPNLDLKKLINNQKNIPSELKNVLIQQMTKSSDLSQAVKNIELLNQLFLDLSNKTQRFNQYMETYINQRNKDSLINLGFWSSFHHTDKGAQNAKTCIKEWTEFHEKEEYNLKKILSDLICKDLNNSNQDLLKKQYSEALNQLNHHAVLFLKRYKGDCRRHSAKTYMMAYIHENKNYIEKSLLNDKKKITSVLSNDKHKICSPNALIFKSTARETKILLDKDREDREKQLENNPDFKTWHSQIKEDNKDNESTLTCWGWLVRN